LMLSQGVPMLLGGDELGRTQGGNNNGYCQDNELSWFDWEAEDGALLEFTRRLIALRHEHPVFRRRNWFHGRPIHGEKVHDITWFNPDGVEMSEEDWEIGYAKALMVFLYGQDLGNDADGEAIMDASFLLIFNAHHELLTFTLPPKGWGNRWNKVVNTAEAAPQEGEPFEATAKIAVEAHSFVLLQGNLPGEAS